MIGKIESVEDSCQEQARPKYYFTITIRSGLELFFITHGPTGSIYMSPKAPTAEVNHNNLRYPVKEIERDQ